MHVLSLRASPAKQTPKRFIRIFRVLSGAPWGLPARWTANLAGKTKKYFIVSLINWQVYVSTSSHFFLSEWPVSFFRKMNVRLSLIDP